MGFGEPFPRAGLSPVGERVFLLNMFSFYLE